MRAVCVHQFGGPEVLSLEELPEPIPGRDEVLIRVTSAGVNFVDLMRRRGVYSGTELPIVLGAEAAGRVVRTGGSVRDVKPGDLVMALTRGRGGQAECVAVAASDVFPIPAGVDVQHAGAIPLVSLTAYHTLKTKARLQPGETVLIQAGASGVGTIAIQLAKLWGATVLATASTEEKLELTRSLGADHAINYQKTDFRSEVKRITGGKGVQVVLECVGGEVFDRSVDCLAPYGRLVSYGCASGTQPSVNAGEFFHRNLAVLGFSMGRTPPGVLDQQAAMRELGPAIASGRIRLIVDRVIPLNQVAEAHRYIAERGARGKVILVP